MGKQQTITVNFWRNKPYRWKKKGVPVPEVTVTLEVVSRPKVTTSSMVATAHVVASEPKKNTPGLTTWSEGLADAKRKEDPRFLEKFRVQFRNKQNWSDKDERIETKHMFVKIPDYVFRGSEGSGISTDIVPRTADGYLMTSGAAHGYSRGSIFTSLPSHLSVALYYSIHHREVGEEATVNVYSTCQQDIGITMFDLSMFKDPLLRETRWCGVRWGRWSFEISVGTVPHSSQISKHTFAVAVNMKDWAECYQKEHPCSTFNTLPPGREFLKTKFKIYLPQHACQFNGTCQVNKGEPGKGTGKGELGKGTGKGEPCTGAGNGEPSKGTGKGEPSKGTF